MKFETKAIHGGQQHEPSTGAVSMPIYQTSTFAQTAPGVHKGYEYSRSGNPTRTALEKAFASLENGAHGFAFASGIAAVDCVLKLLKPGDEVLTTNDIYGGSFRIFTQVFERYNIKFQFIKHDDVHKMDQYFTDNTKLIWIETPSNPLLNLVDIKKITSLAKPKNILVAVDNTFATPYLQRPLDLGADIVMHSATKYLGGHSDVILGGLIVKDKNLTDELYFIQKSCGAIAGPMDSFLVLRGIKTLHLRMECHCSNAKELAHFLKAHSKVDNVYWPGFKTHPNHVIAKSQMKDFGGMVSFTLKNNQLSSTLKILEGLSLFTVGESLGGVESLCSHPVSMSHASVPKKDRDSVGIVDSLIRVSVGIENIEDLIADLDQALDLI
ncbi:trans-sulfuration enzyme family protein [Urechidicola vernalis]|uniref:PLP-dependent aspartate aminotransferase family protein n=1 Tax=Urechidicola vernalis TaxID=3075600 RepID=A0ABU2Y695_9FLAO|nr:PLP-dependent aspartate aminotransferase family protein [Urechidicola sp. P050]MDT0553715.1 PLP-dependent aspartate aminotransferase family protein [Urechidicola sp. P050]